MAGTYTIPLNTKNVLVGDFMRKNIVDQFFKGNPILYRAKGKTEDFTGGRSIQVPMIWKQEGNGGAWIKGADIIDTTVRDPLDMLIFHPKTAVIPVAWTWEDDLDISGPTQLKSIAKTKGDIAKETARNLIGNNMFNAGTNANAMMGLQYILKGYTGASLASQTYGGKTRSGTYAQSGATNNWLVHYGDSTLYDDVAGGNFDPGATNTNLAVLKPLQKAWSRIFYQSGKFPTMIVSNIGSFNCYHNALVINDRYQRPQQSPKMAESGYDSLKFHMADWVVDPNATRDSTPTESIYFINENSTKLFVHPEANFKFFPYREPHNQLAQVAFIVWRGEYIATEPRANGVMSNVKVATSS